MRDYAIRRLILIIPTMLLASTMIFGLMRYLPGDVAQIIIAQIKAGAEYSEEELNELRGKLGLNKPIHIQYGEFIGGLFKGDLGTSLWTKQPVVNEMIHRFPVSVQLISMAVVMGWIMGVGVGVISALKQDTRLDYLGRSFAIAGLSVPSFWVGILIIVLPALWFRWTPLQQFVYLTEDPVRNLEIMILPALILAINLGAPVMRLSRTTLLEVLRQDYIRTAYAKGLVERVVIGRHAIRNALIPVVTVMSLQIISGLSGTVILESLFGIPGMGRLLVSEALAKRDYPMIQAINVLVAFIVVIVNLLVDLSYGFLDPRVRYR